MIFLAVCIAVGLALGQRFKVLALIPATALIEALFLVTRMAGAETNWPIALVGAVILQVGYVIGLAARLRIDSRTSLHRHTPLRRPAH